MKDTTIPNEHVEALLSNDMAIGSSHSAMEDPPATASGSSCVSSVPQPGTTLMAPEDEDEGYAFDLRSHDTAGSCFPTIESNGVSLEGIPLYTGDDEDFDDDEAGAIILPKTSQAYEPLSTLDGEVSCPRRSIKATQEEDLLDDVPAGSCIARLSTDPGDPAQSIPLAPLPVKHDGHGSREAATGSDGLEGSPQEPVHDWK